MACIFKCKCFRPRQGRIPRQFIPRHYLPLSSALSTPLCHTTHFSVILSTLSITLFIPRCVRQDGNTWINAHTLVVVPKPFSRLARGFLCVHAPLEPKWPVFQMRAADRIGMEPMVVDGYNLPIVQYNCSSCDCICCLKHCIQMPTYLLRNLGVTSEFSRQLEA